jgi:hypothetical protein
VIVQQITQDGVVEIYKTVHVIWRTVEKGGGQKVRFKLGPIDALHVTTPDNNPLSTGPRKISFSENKEMIRHV